MVLLDRDEDEVLAAVESGVLGWAWNIARPGAERRELRIWAPSLLSLLAGGRPEAATPRSQESGAAQPGEELLTLLRGILPGRDVRSTELQRFFSCSGSHVAHLLQDGCLAPAALRQCEDGPNSFTRVKRDSVVKFLGGRRVK